MEEEDEICLIFTSNELSYAGIDPNQMRFKRAGALMWECNAAAGDTSRWNSA